LTAAHARRIEELRRRVLVRAWQYRQRHHAAGVWFRLRRALADASAAFVIPPDEARKLLSEGFRADPVGDAVQPRKVILSVSADRVARIPAARSVPVRLGRELLEAECVALTPFEATG
jgi:hypothetical protein